MWQDCSHKNILYKIQEGLEKWQGNGLGLWRKKCQFYQLWKWLSSHYSYDDGCFGKIDSSSLIVDFGASFHTISNIELFTIYNSDNFGMMKMRNGNESRVVSIGNVHMVISLSHKLILNDVRHVLNLWANLLSSNKLDKIDNSF